MTKIKILPKDLVNQIAAGEVVERPASVVKELVENALDAQATFIEIEVESGGKEKILVRDNGEGMSPEDAKIAVKRYSTSKIKAVEDLTQIQSFGFRGEALASIASVSKFTIKTKTAAALEGTEIIVGENNKIGQKSCAHPQGTTIIVKDLFYNIPARKKFLKSTRTELKHIKEFVNAQAIAKPEVGFVLKHNQKELLNLPEEQSFKQRITSALDLSMENYQPVDISAQYFDLKGYIGLPEVARKRQKNQYLFVNNRYLTNKTITGAVYKAYQNILPRGINPPFILKLTIREDLIDVNVHPRKEEVKFVNPSTVFSSIHQAVKSALSEAAEQAAVSFQTAADQQRQKPTPTSTSQPKTKKIIGGRQGKIFQAPKQPTIAEKKAFTTHFLQDIDNYNPPQEQPVLQVANLYLIVPQQDGILIYDQHAAEEKVLFEEFKKKYQSQRSENKQQKLLFKESFALDQEDRQLLKKHQQTLEKIGFKFAVKETKVLISAVPVVLQNKDFQQIIKEFLDDLQTNQEHQLPKDIGLSKQAAEALHFLACRSAVKQGDKLSLEKRKQLIKKLSSLEEKGLTCPHGRPTRIKLSLKKLNKMFKRS
jgi:DNA mismatch repair protein MutL